MFQSSSREDDDDDFLRGDQAELYWDPPRASAEPTPSIRRQSPVVGHFISTKVVVIGSRQVGKTSMLMHFCNLPLVEGAYIPKLLDKRTEQYECAGLRFDLHLWDACDWWYDTLRPLAYLETNVIVIAFAVDDYNSFEKVQLTWAPELKEHSPEVPVLLVACKVDLREDSEAIRKRRQRGDKPLVTFEQGQSLAKTIGAYAYVECSQKTGVGITKVFEAVCRVQVSQLIDLPGRVKKKKQKADAYRRKLFTDPKSLKKYRRVVEKADLAEKMQLREILAAKMKEAKLFCEKYVRTSVYENLPKLSWDVVKHILHKFVLIDLQRDVLAFQQPFSLHRDYFSMSQDPFEVRKLFFGVNKLGADRDFFQVFANFACVGFEQFPHLPMYKRSLRMSDGDNMTLLGLSDPSHFHYGSGNFYAKSREIKKVLSVPYNGGASLQFVKKYAKGAVMLKVVLIADNLKNILSDISFFTKVRSLVLADGRPRRGVRTTSTFIGMRKLRLPNLASLAISGRAVQKAFQFNAESFSSLRKLVIASAPVTTKKSQRRKPKVVERSDTKKRVMSSQHLAGILSLPCLETILFSEVDIQSEEAGFVKLLSEKKSLRELVVVECLFDYSILSSCVFSDVPRLNLLVILHCPDLIVQKASPGVFQSLLQERSLHSVESVGGKTDDEELISLRPKLQVPASQFLYCHTWGSDEDVHRASNFPDDDLMLDRIDREVGRAAKIE